MSPLSRRSLLQGSALGLLGAMLGTAPAPAAAGASLASVNPLIRPTASGTAGSASKAAAFQPSNQYSAPYTVTPSCVLTEDYFLSDAVLMGDPTDTVRAYLATSGAVEALVVTGGALARVSRDSTTTSGWAFTVLDLGGLLTGVTDVAVGRDNTGTAWAVVNTANNTGWVLMSQDGKGTWQTGEDEYGNFWGDNGDLGGPVGPMQPSNDGDGYLYFAAFFNNGTNGIDDNTLAIWDPYQLDPVNGDGQDYFTVDWLVGKDLGGRVVTPYVLWSDYAPATGVGVLAADSAGNIVWYTQQANGYDGGAEYQIGGVSQGVEQFLWADAGTSDMPGPRFVMRWGSIVTCVAGNEIFLGSVVSITGVDSVDIWESGDSFAVAAVGGDNVLHVMGLYPADGDGQGATPFIPVRDDLLSVSSCISDPNDATLFTVDVGLNLGILTKAPTTGVTGADPATVSTWNYQPVHQNSPTAQEIDCWRTQLTVVDANGVPVSNTPVQITPDRAIGLWQPGGNVVMDPSNPVTLTTDGFGRLTFSLPATEVDSAWLSVQVMPNGQPSGAPTWVNPGADVHAFLAGSAPLNDLGTLGGPAMLAATNSGGTSLFPVLNNIADPTQQGTAATGCAAAIGQCLLAGQGAPAANGAQSFQLDMSGSTPMYAESTDPDNFPPLQSVGGAVGGIDSWWEAAKHDAESVYHGVRRGLIKVGKCLATYAKDAAQWTVNLAITIGDDISDVISYAITDIRSAIHAVSGFFHTLGADLADAIHWLKMFLGNLFRNAEANTQTMLGWLRDFGGQLDSGLTTAAGLAAGFFTGLKTWVTDMLDTNVVPAATGITVGNTGSALLDVTDMTDVAAVGGSLDLGSMISDVRHNWLFEKVFAELDLLAEGGGTDDALGDKVVDLINAMSPTTLIGELAGDLWTAIEDVVKAAADLKGLPVTTLIGVFQNAIDDVLNYLDTVVAALIALMQAIIDGIGDFLDTNLIDTLPLLGGILSALGIDDSSLTVGHVYGLILMFPTTVVHSVVTGSTSPMFNYNDVDVDVDVDLAAAVSDPLARDLMITHGVIRALCGLIDVPVDAFILLDDEAPPGTRLAPLRWVGMFDAVATLAIQVTVYPSPKVDGKVVPPCSTPPALPPGELGNEVLAKLVLGAANPLLAIVMQSAKLLGKGIPANYTKWLQIFRSLMAATSLGLGMDIDVKKGGTRPVAYVAQCCEMATLIISPFAMAFVNDENEFVPIAVKAVGDVGEAISGGLFIGMGIDM